MSEMTEMPATGISANTPMRSRSTPVWVSRATSEPRKCAIATSATARLAVITYVKRSDSPNSRNATAFSGNSPAMIRPMTAPADRHERDGRLGIRLPEADLGRVGRGEVLELRLEAREALVLLGLPALVVLASGVAPSLGLGQALGRVRGALLEVGQLDREGTVVPLPPLDELMHLLLGPRQDLAQVERDRLVPDGGA